MEVNGVSADPVHVYETGYPLLRAYSEMFAHWRAIAEISRQNRDLGHPHMTTRELLRLAKQFAAHKRWQCRALRGNTGTRRPVRQQMG